MSLSSPPFTVYYFSSVSSVYRFLSLFCLPFLLTMNHENTPAPICGLQKCNPHTKSIDSEEILHFVQDDRDEYHEHYPPSLKEWYIPTLFSN